MPLLKNFAPFFQNFFPKNVFSYSKKGENNILKDFLAIYSKLYTVKLGYNEQLGHFCSL